MNKKSIILSIFLSTCIALANFAQSQDSDSLDIFKMQKMRLKVVELFEDYEKFCQIDASSPEDAPIFNALFVSDEAPVYNDLIGIAYEKSLPVGEYARLMSENSETTRASISNLVCQSPYPYRDDDGRWTMKCTFDKKISLTNECGIEFASDFFNNSDYHLSAIIVYVPDENDPDNLDKGKWQFQQIDGETQPKIQLAEGYHVVIKKSERDADVLFDNKPLLFNKKGQAFVSPTGRFVYSSDLDVVVKEVVDDEQCNKTHLKYSTKSWRIKPNFSMSLGKPLTVANESKFNSVGSKAISFGVDAGYIFPTKGKIKIGAFMGLGISSSSLDLSLQQDEYSFTTDHDVDGDTYKRIYENLNVSQTTKIKEFSIPVYADFDWRFSRWGSFYIDLGLKLNMNMSTTAGDFEGKAGEVYGIYSQYDNLRLDHHWGYNGFTQNLNLTKDNLCDGENLSVKKFAPNLLIGAGFRFNIPRTPLALDLGIGYQKGFGDLISVSENTDEINNGKLFYNVVNGKESTEYAHDLVESTGGVSRGYLNLNLGLLIKF